MVLDYVEELERCHVWGNFIQRVSFDSSEANQKMISVNPSGFACSYNESALDNLSHEHGGKKEFSANRSRRGRFYNVLSCLHFSEPIQTFWTFTIKDLQTNFETSDGFYSGQFQKLLEGLTLRYKRGKTNGLKNFVWVSEAQERGNIHFHLVTSTKFLSVQFVQDYWNKLVGQDSKNSVDVEFIKESSIRNISGYFAKYMSKSHDLNEQKNGLKGRVIFAKSFGYSRNFKIFENFKIHRNQLLLQFPELENTKVTKKISEEISIDYYFLNSEKVIEFLKIKEKEEREAQEREAKAREAIGFI
jgi:hypothetical protein